MDEKQKSPLEGLIESEEAAKILGISISRLYDYLREERIPSQRVGKSYIMRLEDVERFKANPIGRKRTRPTAWRLYQSGVRLFGVEMRVAIRPGQQEHLSEKLRAIQHMGQYTFPGTIARYVLQNSSQPDTIEILLLWKSSEMPDEQIRQQHLNAFQHELSDLLDWETAQITTTEALLHT
ncbi:MAG TPA: helix-turn-helix domain-containing protein [Ktedonobacteraceae bacterium]|nr:helix-turn-helix domain-containing protein [Ktedonobacteraceae bacterium]